MGKLKLWGRTVSHTYVIGQMMCILGFRRKLSGSVGLGLERKGVNQSQDKWFASHSSMVSRCEIIRVCVSQWQGKKWTDLTSVSELTGADGY